MVLLILVILGVAAFSFYKGYILVGFVCLFGFSRKYGWPALIFTSVYLFYKGDFIVGALPIALIIWNIYGLVLMSRKGTDTGWTTLVHESYKYCRKSDYWKSIKLAEKALELNPRASEAWRLIGNAYEFLGDEREESGNLDEAVNFHKKATEAWNKAKEINPEIMIPGYHD